MFATVTASTARERALATAIEPTAPLAREQALLAHRLEEPRDDIVHVLGCVLDEVAERVADVALGAGPVDQLPDDTAGGIETEVAARRDVQQHDLAGGKLAANAKFRSSTPFPSLSTR